MLEGGISKGSMGDNKNFTRAQIPGAAPRERPRATKGAICPICEKAHNDGGSYQVPAACNDEVLRILRGRGSMEDKLWQLHRKFPGLVGIVSYEGIIALLNARR